MSLSQPTKGSPLATCARQSWLQNCCPLLQSCQTATTFVSYLFVYSCHIDSHVSWGLLRQTYCQHSLHSSSTNIAARRFSWCAPSVWNSLPSFVRTADSFTSFRSQLKTYVCKSFVATRLSHVTNLLLTYLH